MNRKIIIRNIGPIREVSLSLNTINVFMGPQSSGKSTIAKLLSFCMWVEKDVTLRQGVEFIDSGFLEKELFDFHRVRSYFDDKSYFRFESDIMLLEYKDKQVNVSTKPELELASVGKVSYIPAERIIVSLPNVQKYELPYQNLRSFVFDWLTIRTKFDSSNPISINELNQQYYYDSASGRDIMILNNGDKIPFTESSSGIQSYVPLFVSMKYMTEWIYNNQEDISYEKKELIDKVIARKFLSANQYNGGDLTEAQFSQIQSDSQIQQIVQSLSRVINRIDPITNPKDKFETALSMAVNLSKRLSRTHFSDIVIEEPELNLFPETQSAVVREVLKTVTDRDVCYIITTHSPYILYSLNNYMLGWLIRDALIEDGNDLMLKYKDSFIDPNRVSVWEIKDGEFRSMEDNTSKTIQDKDGLIRRNYFNQSMKSIMSEFNSFIGYYDKD